MSKDIKNNEHDENEGDKNLDLQNRYKMSDKDQAKAGSHEYKRV